MTTDGVVSLSDEAVVLACRMRGRSRSVIESELRRLSRRVPTLRTADLAAIDAALDDMVVALVIGLVGDRFRGSAEFAHLTRPASDSASCEHERLETTASDGFRSG